MEPKFYTTVAWSMGYVDGAVWFNTSSFKELPRVNSLEVEFYVFVELCYGMVSKTRREPYHNQREPQP